MDKIGLLEVQKRMLEEILEDGYGGGWLFEMGDLDVLHRIRDIIDKECYYSFDKEFLNEIRELWLGGVKMRI